ncbi:MAG: histidine kinase dimerization/phospho-acceptor domain-containing protein [Candidatus Zixiibacteriota bacterium]
MFEKRKALVCVGADIDATRKSDFCARDQGMDCCFASNRDSINNHLKNNNFDLMIIDNDVAADSGQFHYLMSIAAARNMPVVVTRVVERPVESQPPAEEPIEPFIRKLILRRNQAESIVDYRDKLNLGSETAATLSHEINNPLMAISANAEMLLRKRAELSPDMVEKAEAIAHAAERIRKVTHRLTDLDSLRFRETAAGRMIDFEISVNRADFEPVHSGENSDE